MIAGVVGRWFELVGRLRGGPAGADLAQVGAELRRLERPDVQRPATSR